MDQMRNKKIVIIGFGKEGLATANFLGQNNKITIIDDKPEGEIEETFFQRLKVKSVTFYFRSRLPRGRSFDLLVRSPSVRPDHPIIKFFSQKGTITTSPTNIFFKNCPAKIIGVTGTKGKGTTSTLIYEITRAENKNVFLAGNVGIPALEILPKLDSQSIAILELSSFQLIDLKYSPHIAVVLMITSEHLDWHKNEDEYIDAKKSIIKFQSPQDFAVINQDFEWSKKFANLTQAKAYYFSIIDKTNGVYVKKNKIYSEVDGHKTILKSSEILLPGRHNQQNVCAAIAVAKILNIKNKNIQKTVTTFTGLKHRLQSVKEIAGVRYYDDSYSTIPETTIAAIEAFKKPKILILGGSSKNSDFLTLSRKIVNDKSIKAIILIGQEARTIKKSINKVGQFRGKIIEGLKSIKEIVKTSSKISQSGDIVILSPACASFDMFKNYEKRGEEFVREVLKLEK